MYVIKCQFWYCVYLISSNLGGLGNACMHWKKKDTTTDRDAYASQFLSWKKKLKRLQNQSYFTLIIDVILPGFSCSDRKDQMRWMLSFPREAQKIPSSSLRRSSQTWNCFSSHMTSVHAFDFSGSHEFGATIVSTCCRSLKLSAN